MLCGCGDGMCYVGVVMVCAVGVVMLCAVGVVMTHPPPQVFEGYGQTECTAGATATLVGEHESGHVGPPLTCNYIKLMDVKDMNYFAESNEGEVGHWCPLCIWAPPLNMSSLPVSHTYFFKPHLPHKPRLLPHKPHLLTSSSP